MTFGAHLKSVISISVITLQLAFWALVLVLLGLLKLLVPPLRASVDRAMDALYRAAVAIDDVWLRRVLGIDWDRPALGLSRDRSVVVLSNHASWADILLLQSVLVRDGPLLKFLAKRELVYIPIFGVIFWAFDFPMLRRRSGEGEDEAERRRRDLEELRSACRVVRDRPAAIMNFAEGTRFTEEKRLARQSPYRHLLPPRLGGLAALLDALEGQVDAIVDVTLLYPESISFWGFLSGQYQRIEIDVECVPIADVPESREGLADWLAARWARKDGLIAAARESKQG